MLACLWFWRTKISLPNRRFRQKYHNRVAKQQDNKSQRKAKGDKDDKDDKGRGRDRDDDEGGTVRVDFDGQPFNGPRRLSLFGQTTWSISSAVSSVGDRLRRYSVSTVRSAQVLVSVAFHFGIPGMCNKDDRDGIRDRDGVEGDMVATGNHYTIRSACRPLSSHRSDLATWSISLVASIVGDRLRHDFVSLDVQYLSIVLFMSRS